MVILRPTGKLHSVLRRSDRVPTSSDTALGDWYVNRLVLDRQPLLLLVSSAALVPLVVPARDVRGLPSRLASLVTARLGRFGLRQDILDAETSAMGSVLIGPTIDRSVLGIMVDFAKAIPFYLEPGRWDDSPLQAVEDRLAETPCHASKRSDRVVFPDKIGPELLQNKWLANMPLQPTSGRTVH
jgi:hypothetical protein